MVGASLPWEEKILDHCPQAKKALCVDGYSTKVGLKEVSLDSFLGSQEAKVSIGFTLRKEKNFLMIKLVGEQE